ncbi:unknown [Firmicutes bacterium CAG:555]|nr:unknown [Firmicutes bacterium CAG:555]
MSDNSINFRKTGFGLVNQTAPESVFFIFRAKIPRTFWGKYTEQSSRKKLADGGFES